MAMLDVAMILMASHVTGYLRNGKHPKPVGNRQHHATNMAYQTADGLVMLGASNLRQQKRIWTVLERPDLIKRTNDERERRLPARARHPGRHPAEPAPPRNGKNGSRPATSRPPACARWARRWPIRRLQARSLLHTHENAPGIPGKATVPVAAFRFAHDGPRVDRPPPMFSQHTHEVLAELGYTEADIDAFRRRR